MSKRLFRRTLLAAGLGVCLPLAAGFADAWPNRPIRMLSPLPPGTLHDATMRLFSEGLAQSLARPGGLVTGFALVENNGAATRLGFAIPPLLLARAEEVIE